MSSQPFLITDDAGGRASRRRRGADPACRPLGYYPTPLWVTEALVERYFPELDDDDCVLEPTCGPGGFLQAIPAHVRAIGVELQPGVAAMARQVTGREVLTGDIATIELTCRPTAIIGNPPFRMALVDRILERAYEWLPEGGRCGLLLPASAFQTAKRVVEYNRRWSLQQDALPRNIYPNLKSPLVFAVFGKDRRRTLVGFALYRETAAVQDLAPATRAILEEGPPAVDPRFGPTRSVWQHAIAEALRTLGGEADIRAIYAQMEGRRPTANPAWREQIRKRLQSDFVRTGRGRYALPVAALAA